MINYQLLDSIHEDGALNSFLVEFNVEEHGLHIYTDEDVIRIVANYPPQGYRPGYHRDQVAAGRKFLSLPNPNWEGFRHLVNRRFDYDDDKCRAWLERMLNLLEAELDKKDEEYRKSHPTIE